MRACTECELPLVARMDDGTGKHQQCPPKPNRERYLAEKRRKLPGLCALQDAIMRNGEPFAALKELDRKDEG